MVKMKESIRMWHHIFWLIFPHHIWEDKEKIVFSGGGGAGEAASTVSTRLGLVRGWVSKQGRSKRLKHHTVQDSETEDSKRQ